MWPLFKKTPKTNVFCSESLCSNISNQFHPSPWWKAGLHFFIRAKRWRVHDLHPSGRGVIRGAHSAESITIAMERYTSVFTSLGTRHDLTMIDWAAPCLQNSGQMAHINLSEIKQLNFTALIFPICANSHRALITHTWPDSEKKKKTIHHHQSVIHYPSKAPSNGLQKAIKCEEIKIWLCLNPVHSNTGHIYSCWK